MKKKILFVTRGPKDASTRYRVDYLLEELTNRDWHAFQVSRKDRFLRSRILWFAATGSVIFIQRKLFGAIFVVILRALTNRIVFDFDDAIFVKSSGKPDQRRYRQFSKIIGASKLVLAGNPYLAEEANKHNSPDRVLLTPTCIDVERYRVAPSAGSKNELVWIGSKSTSRYLTDHSQHLSAIAAKNPTICLKIIGDFEWSHPSLPTRTVPWSEETEIQELKGCLAGIAPMPDDAWTQGKCALKSIQYMGAGIPVIASNSGMHCSLIKNGQNGSLVDTPEEWANAAFTLAHDSTKRSELADQALQVVTEDFDIRRLAVWVCDAIDRSISRN